MRQMLLRSAEKDHIEPSGPTFVTESFITKEAKMIGIAPEHLRLHENSLNFEVIISDLSQIGLVNPVKKQGSFDKALCMLESRSLD